MKALSRIKSRPLREAAQHVLDDFRFSLAPGAINSHHIETGGLLRHTTEVVTIALDMARSLPDVIIDDLIVAAIWHDYGKVWAYVPALEVPEEVAYKRLADFLAVSPISPTLVRWKDSAIKDWQGGHLARSYSEFLIYAQNGKMSNDSVEHISHCILAHHGDRNKGSPAIPQTATAWVLHLADTASASIDSMQRKALSHER